LNFLDIINFITVYTLMRFLITFLTVFIFWSMLSGTFTKILFASALIYSLLTAYFSYDYFIESINFTGIKRIFKFIAYLPWLFWEIIVANLQVAYIVLSPKMPISPELVETETDLKTDYGKTALGNSITLTPGTVTIEIENSKILVHAITKEHAQDIKNKDIEKKILRIEA